MPRGLARFASLATAVALALALAAPVSTVAADAPARDRSAEQYAHGLMNCTRTGGWVKADGTCVNRGSGEYSAYRKPLRLHSRLSWKVAAPWAKAMIVHDVCGHAIAGKPSLRKRFTKKGFGYPTYGENVGCGWGYGDPKDVVLMTHRMFQKEKPYKGGHWKNIKSKLYKSVGIGVATRNGRTTVVYDFYGKKY